MFHGIKNAIVFYNLSTLPYHLYIEQLLLNQVFENTYKNIKEFLSWLSLCHKPSFLYLLFKYCSDERAYILLSKYEI